MQMAQCSKRRVHNQHIAFAYPQIVLKMFEHPTVDEELSGLSKVLVLTRKISVLKIQKKKKMFEKTASPLYALLIWQTTVQE